MSRIACVEPDWQNVEDGKKLPVRFALKISSQLALVALSKMLNFGGGNGFTEEKLKKFSKLTRKSHNIEVETYKVLTKFNHPDIPYTKVYSLKPFNGEDDLKGYLITDFIPNVHVIEAYKSIPADNIAATIRGIATFSALAEHLEREEQKSFMSTDFLELLFEDFFTDAELSKKFEALKTKFEGQQHAEKVSKLIKVFAHYKALVKKYTNISDLLGLKPVFIHGDLWQSNIMFTLDNSKKLKLEAIIDWQSVSRIPPGIDLSRIMLGCLSAQERRERGTELLKLYHETYAKVFGKELFTFQELQDSYNLYAPMMAMLILPSLSSFLDSAQISKEEKAAAAEEVNLKEVAMIEDILDIHESNLKKFSSFMEI